ncbi:MAG: hypothetical protein NDF54_00825 [archaeon GB-1867-035]|nr:hypothetical protein [Candidatus Culexmicrobium profundum]
MNNKTLQFWGKEVIVEMDSNELKLYIGYETIMIPLILMIEKKVPSRIIPLKSLKRVDLYENNKVAIFWEIADESGVIYRTKREVIELYEEDAERLYNALSDLLRGTSFQQIIKKYKVKFKPGEIIKDDENVVIFRDLYQTATIMSPEIYEVLYENKKPKSIIKKLYHTMLQMAPTLYVVDNILYSDVLRVEQPRKVRGKYVVKIILNDGSTFKVKFKDYGNVIRFRQLLIKKSEWAKKHFKKPPKIITHGKLWSIGGLIFISSYWLMTSIMRIPSRIASLYALIICIAIVAITWTIIKRK